jgi:hypothetical protein
MSHLGSDNILLNNQFIINLHTDSEEKTRAEKTIEQEKFELKINLEIQIFIVRQSFNMNFQSKLTFNGCIY